MLLWDKTEREAEEAVGVREVMVVIGKEAVTKVEVLVKMLARWQRQWKGEDGGSGDSGDGGTGDGDRSIGGRGNDGGKSVNVKRIENICPHKNLYMNVQSSITHNSQKVKTVQMAING